MAEAKKPKPAGKTAASKSGSAVKRGTQNPKAGSKGGSPAPVAERERVSTPQRSQNSKSNDVVNGLSEQAARQSEASAEQEQRQSIFKKLIDVLKRIIGYKKGERNEFRYNYDEHHPAYEIKEEDGKAITFGVTHSAETFGIKNMPLAENPNPTDSRDSYIRNGVIITKKKRLSRKKLDGWKISDRDKPNVKSKRRNQEKESKRQAAEQKANNKKSK